MFQRRLYYSLKPYLPWRLRMALRRHRARRVLAESAHTWPILESAGAVPAGWPGWPEGKAFSFVLSHDVEGQEGLQKCRQLAQLEMDLGFRSVFNFIPEGTYAVPSDLRTWLQANGFEVGVHDLSHDGKLFNSREGFTSKVPQINRYVSEWGAAGFRAGFMMRNLEWYHDLDIQYDASTFDTDPFEPMPDGARTIFPFWVPAPATQSLGDRRRAVASGERGLTPSSLSVQREGQPSGARTKEGYVELPYTLPQDSTLFLLLREVSPKIWQQKLEWIIARGGMTFLNVHPDYIDFASRRVSDRHYPVCFYSDFLTAVASQYRGKYWNPLPRELTAWFNSARPALLASAGTPVNAGVGSESKMAECTRQLRGKRAAVLLYSNYPADPRPRRAAEAMIEAGMEVDLLCLSEKDGDPAEEVVRGVRVFRVSLRRRRDGKWTYLRQYSQFILSSFWFLLRQSTRRRYDVVHVHNMPDVLVFSALVPKILGSRIVLDLHDPMPELMMTIFRATEKSFSIRVLKSLERWSIAFADSVLTVNEACKRLFSKRSCASSKVGVIMNSPDEAIFCFKPIAPLTSPDPNQPRSFVIMYHGSLVERHGLDLAVSALTSIRKSIPQAELHVYGHRTAYLDRVLDSIKGTAVENAVSYRGPKNLEGIVEAIQQCDVGVIPNRRSIFTEINTPTRIFEYLALGKPVVAPKAPGILDYFGPKDLIYFELGDAVDLARALESVYRNSVETTLTIERGQAIYRRHCWSAERLQFLSSIARTLAPEQASTLGTPAGTLSGRNHPR